MARGADIGTEMPKALREAVQRLMETGGFEGTFTLARTPGGGVDYFLSTKEEGAPELLPLHPVMPNHAGRLLREMTLGGAMRGKVLVITRPCELRGFVEIVKRLQGCLDNLVFLSVVCGGVFPLSMVSAGWDGKRTEEYWAYPDGRPVQGLRPACQGCTEFIPYTADLVVAPSANGHWALTAGSEEGGRLIERAFPSAPAAEMDPKALEAMAVARKAGREEVLSHEADVKGLSDLVKVFGRCIGCHACSKACPICYCTLCTFESSRMEDRMEQSKGQLEVKGGIRAPAGTVLFHIGRMGHMAVSCVACGCCQDVCPVGIPVSLLFKKVGEAVQARFEYVPGRDVKEALPINTFQPMEFKEMGE
jgi:formate dehydrogenase subunit beta